MKNIILKSVIGLACVAGMSSCGNSWLETKYYGGVEADGALTSPTVIEYALNGVYYQLERYYFAGNYSTTLGDIASDIVYWQGNNNHQNDLYQFTYQDTSNTLYYVWNYGYKVVDNAARVIEACEALMPEATADDQEYLMIMEAEARCLRAYANLTMVNIFAKQAMVAGSSNLNTPGLVLVETPVEAFSQVERATVGQTYDFIFKDLQEAVSLFNSLGYDRGDVNFMNLAAAYALEARAYTYLENWSAAASAAQNAIEISGINELAYTTEEYNALYKGGDSNWESFFTLGINSLDNWSANSCGTLFTTYGYSITPYLVSLLNEDDCRYYLYTAFDEAAGGAWSENNTYYGAKFYFGFGNTAYATNYIINAPEMFLIQAEAYAQQGQVAQAQDALYVVAHRNPAIASPADLPSTKDGIMSFLYEERARELFQEGLRMYDLRRWNITCNLYAVHAPEVEWMIKNVQIGNLVLPIPQDEINTKFGVTQNEGWDASKPR